MSSEYNVSCWLRACGCVSPRFCCRQSVRGFDAEHEESADSFPLLRLILTVGEFVWTAALFPASIGLFGLSSK